MRYRVRITQMIDLLIAINKAAEDDGIFIYTEDYNTCIVILNGRLAEVLEKVDSLLYEKVIKPALERSKHE